MPKHSVTIPADIQSPGQPPRDNVRVTFSAIWDGIGPPPHLEAVNADNGEAIPLEHFSDAMRRRAKVALRQVVFDAEAEADARETQRRERQARRDAFIAAALPEAMRIAESMRTDSFPADAMVTLAKMDKSAHGKQGIAAIIAVRTADAVLSASDVAGNGASGLATPPAHCEPLTDEQWNRIAELVTRRASNTESK